MSKKTKNSELQDIRISRGTSKDSEVSIKIYSSEYRSHR
jgi:hypothetical protein